jgi:Domain of unknown function (DUF4157)
MVVPRSAAQTSDAVAWSKTFERPRIRTDPRPEQIEGGPVQGPEDYGSFRFGAIPFSFSDISIYPAALGSLQRKLSIGSAGDESEQQAETIAAKVLRMPSPTVQRQCSCGGDRVRCKPKRNEERLQRISLSAPGPAALPPSVSFHVPPVVTETLRSPGVALDAETQNYMEERFGYGFGHVRVHTDSKATESAAAVAAHAYTVGSDVVFGAGRYAPNSAEGRHLLAHELTHVIQQGSDRATPRLQRFAASETNRIAPTFADMLTQVKTLVDASRLENLGDVVDLDNLVEIAGGQAAYRKLDEKTGSKHDTIKSRLFNRYQFTCRCGLLDMRHFFQIMYIAWFGRYIKPSFGGRSKKDANQDATGKGREHELTAESASRFGAEDTPSNALAALTGAGLSELPGVDDVYDEIKDTLTRCGPVDWTSLIPASQKTIIRYYGDMEPDPTPKKAGDQIPVNQNQTAVPVILNIAECSGKERSLPFSIDTSDSDKKTLGGRDFLAGTPGITKGKEVKAFVNTQRPEIIQAIPLSEKIRLLNILLDPPVEDEDREAVAIIRKNSTAQELKAEPTE